MFGYYRPHHYLLALVIGFGLGGFAYGEAHAATLDLDINLASIHTRAWARRELNQKNLGLGMTYHWSRSWAVMGGEYQNSYRRPTWYATGVWTPLHIGSPRHWHADAGLAAGVASGYTHGEVSCEPLMAAGVVRLVAPSDVSLNLLVVPNQPHGGSGFVGFQVSFPIHDRG